MKGLMECKRISKAATVVQNNAYLKPAETELNFPASWIQEDPLWALTTQILSAVIAA